MGLLLMRENSMPVIAVTSLLVVTLFTYSGDRAAITIKIADAKDDVPLNVIQRSF